MSSDAAVRAAAFAFLEAAVDRRDRTVSWRTMLRGFETEAGRVPLASMQGIFKPAMLDLPISIRTQPIEEGKAPRYQDSLSREGFLVYKYQGTDPEHRDNVGLRRCIAGGTPLIYFFGLVPGVYVARWPVRVLADDPARLQFLLSIDEGLRLEEGPEGVGEPAERASRAYTTRTVLHRCHQDSFRRRVLRAYATRCTVCRLRREELLEAAHIIPDSDPRGLPVVRNGLAMCTLHHAAFDGKVMGSGPTT